MMRWIPIFLLLFLHGQFVQTGHHRGTSSPYNPCLISGWPMNEGSGLTLHDLKGGNTATLSGAGAVTWQSNAGFPGTTPSWNATGNALATNVAPTNFTGTTAFSVTVWENVATSGPPTFIGTLNMSSSDIGWEFSYGGSNGPTFYLINTFPGNSIQTQQNGGSITGLHYLAVTYDGSQNTSGVHMYMDGVNQTFTSVNNSLSASAASGLAARFGARNNGSNETTGPFAFVEVYNCVLSAGTISAYNALGPGIY